MNNFKIQKIIFIPLFFSSTLFPLINAYASNLEYILITSKNNRTGEKKNSLDLKSYKNYKLLTNLKTKSKSPGNSQLKSIDKNINTAVNELLIESEIQSERDNILYAEGDVVVKLKDNFLKADSLTYNKKTKLVKAEGNILFKINNQIFQADVVEYNFIKKRGDFKNIKGLINFESFSSDFNFHSNTIYENFLSTIKRIKKDKVIFTPEKVTNWIFSAELLKVDENKWSSKKAFLTNDLLETNQIKLQLNKLKVYPFKDKLKLKSKINYLILEDRIVVPFWFGQRTISIKEGNSSAADFQNRWIIGYDKLNKDGYFIGRELDTIEFNDDLFLKIEPQLLIQRSLKGKTKSFVQEDSSLNSQRVERNISLSDYFALNLSIEGKLKNWDLKIKKELNSFDLDKFANAVRAKAELSKDIKLFNVSFVNKIFGAYRESIWNGSMGESEIYRAYGWRLDKTNSWKNGSVEKSQTITLGLGNYEAEELNSLAFATSYKGSINYQFNQKFPLYEKKIDSEYLDKSFEYIPKPIRQGLYINSNIAANYSLYKYDNSQQYLGVGLGPEMTIGNHKKKFFDYTHIKIQPFYKFKSGKSIFKFDQVSDKFTVNLNFDQQLIGPFLIETKGTINLDQESNHYGEFINSRIAINFKKRSYSVGVFYQPHNQAGGLNFNLNGFK